MLATCPALKYRADKTKPLRGYAGNRLDIPAISPAEVSPGRASSLSRRGFNPGKWNDVRPQSAGLVACQSGASAPGNRNDRPIILSQLSTLNSQLSTLNSQLSTLNSAQGILLATRIAGMFSSRPW